MILLVRQQLRLTELLVVLEQTALLQQLIVQSKLKVFHLVKEFVLQLHLVVQTLIAEGRLASVPLMEVHLPSMLLLTVTHLMLTLVHSYVPLSSVDIVLVMQPM